MRVKSGVDLNGTHYLLFYAAAVYDYMRQSYNLGEGTISGGREEADDVGPARVSTSKHPGGRAIDLRSLDIPADIRTDFGNALQRALGALFVVVQEVDHYHVELRQGRTGGA